MRLPYLQLAEKYIQVQSKVVARKLGIKRCEAIGIGALLFETAVELTSTDETPPSGIILGADAVEILEAGMEWEGEHGKAVGAFERADMIERLENGLRVKGCDRYREAWEKQKRRSDGAKAAAEARWSHAKPLKLVKADADAMRKQCARIHSASLTHAPDTDVDTDVKEEEAGGARPAQLQALWNAEAHPSLPRWEEMPPGREKKARSRLREKPLTVWAAVIARINASAFLRGETERGWKANPDWLLRPDTAAKVLEGNYDDHRGPSPPKDVRKGVVRAEDMDHSKNEVDAHGNIRF